MLGFIIALESETNNILRNYPQTRVISCCGYQVHAIKFLNQHVYLVFSGVGKVNAANAAQVLIQQFKVNKIINIGTCGALTQDIKVNDIILPNVLEYYDVDVTAFGYKKNQIPHENDVFVIDKTFLEDIKAILDLYKIKIHQGKLITGETFINQSNLPALNISNNSMACDMESTAIAQTCEHNNILFAPIKIVSDSIFNKDKNQEQWKNNLHAIGSLINNIFENLSCSLIYRNKA